MVIHMGNLYVTDELEVLEFSDVPSSLRIFVKITLSPSCIYTKI